MICYKFNSGINKVAYCTSEGGCKLKLAIIDLEY